MSPSRLPPPAGRGFSLLEVLVAAAILGIFALGLVPLLLRAAMMQLAARGSTRAAHLAQSRAEELLQTPWEASLLSATAGSEHRIVRYRAIDGARWLDSRPARVEWIRTTRLRRFGASALDDDRLESAEVLPGAIPPHATHFWEIEIEIRTAHSSTPFSAGRHASVTLLKAH